MDMKQSIKTRTRASEGPKEARKERLGILPTIIVDHMAVSLELLHWDLRVSRK